jgi:response regulator NasT
LRIVVIKDPAHEEYMAESLRTGAPGSTMSPTIGPIADELHAGLVEAGYNVIGNIPGDIRLPERIALLMPDLIIIDADSSARDVLEHVVVATRDAPRPIVMFTDHSEPGEMRAGLAAGVSAYMVAGLHPQQVMPILEVALARFQVEQRLRAELESVKNQLAERKIIERAKGLLMSKSGCTEDAAFGMLRRQAMDKNLKLVEVAQRIVDVAELLG